MYVHDLKSLDPKTSKRCNFSQAGPVGAGIRKYLARRTAMIPLQIAIDDRRRGPPPPDRGPKMRKNARIRPLAPLESSILYRDLQSKSDSDLNQI